MELAKTQLTSIIIGQNTNDVRPYIPEIIYENTHRNLMQDPEQYVHIMHIFDTMQRNCKKLTIYIVKKHNSFTFIFPNNWIFESSPFKYPNTRSPTTTDKIVQITLGSITKVFGWVKDNSPQYEYIYPPIIKHPLTGDRD